MGFDSSSFRQMFPKLISGRGKLAEWLRQQVANLSFREGRVGSIPTLSAKVLQHTKSCVYNSLAAQWNAKQMKAVKSDSDPNMGLHLSKKEMSFHRGLS